MGIYYQPQPVSRISAINSIIDSEVPWVRYVTSKEDNPSFPLGFPSPSGCTDINSRQGGKTLVFALRFFGTIGFFCHGLSRAFCWVPYHWGIKWCTGSNLKPKRMLKDSELRTPYRAGEGLFPSFRRKSQRTVCKGTWKPCGESYTLRELASWCRKRVNLYFLFVEDFLRHTHTQTTRWRLVSGVMLETSCGYVSFSLVFPSRWAGPRSVGILHGGPLRP